MAKKLKTPAAEASTVSEQPYYLQRAHIKDYRSIRDAKVEFKPGLNIIIGANGSGKTNFVRAVSSAVDTRPGNSKNLGIEENFKLSGRRDLEIYFERKKVEPQIGMSFSELFQQHVKVYSDGITGEGKDLSEALANNQAINGLEGSGCKAIMLLHGVPDKYNFVDIPVGFKVGEYFESDDFFSRFPNAIMNTFLIALSIQRFNLKLRKVSSRRIADLLLKSVNVHIQELESILNKFTPIQSIRVSDTRFYDDDRRNEVIVKGFNLEFKANNTWLPFTDLSNGTQRMFFVISEFIASDKYLGGADNGMNPVIQEIDKIFLLEEPELGIHPDQLHKLLLFLREQSEKRQIIITTHSPQVLDMLNENELDRITICELDEKKGTQFRNLKKAQIATAKKYMKEVGFLSDYWRYGSLEELN